MHMDKRHGQHISTQLQTLLLIIQLQELAMVHLMAVIMYRR